MGLLLDFIDYFRHLDEHLFNLIQTYGIWIYAILFLIIFVETGLVVMPLLPGDSLLFAAGSFCAGVVKNNVSAELELGIVIPLLIIAAISGDALNYYFGKTIGLKVLTWKIGSRSIVKEKHINQTQQFFDKHGAKAIILARFVPIVRTFAPFVAGIGEMKYRKFLQYNVIGGISWIILLTMAGYLFGNLPIVSENFETVVFIIIGISILPMIYEIIKQKIKSKKP